MSCIRFTGIVCHQLKLTAVLLSQVSMHRSWLPWQDKCVYMLVLYAHSSHSCLPAYISTTRDLITVLQNSSAPFTRSRMLSSVRPPTLSICVSNIFVVVCGDHKFRVERFCEPPMLFNSYLFVYVQICFISHMPSEAFIYRFRNRLTHFQKGKLVCSTEKCS